MPRKIPQNSKQLINSDVKYESCAIKMSSRLSKSWPGILVSSIAVLIFLSVPTSAEEAEPKKCYWCGPLAEQVHRSQRAPSCAHFDLEQHETVCDKGYTHCAIIATSPPYAESRLCVKFYQDECYSLYCNSTKTWRTICACRGDLCNGPRTERETKAFAIAQRHGKTNARNKRALISNGFISVKTKTPAENITIIIINNKTETNATTNNEQNDQPDKETQGTSNENIVMNMPKNIEDNIIIEHGTIGNTEGVIISSKDESNDENKMYSPTITVTEENNINTHSAATTMAATVTEDLHLDNAIDEPTTGILDLTTAANMVKEIHDDEVTMSSLAKTTSMEIEVTVIHKSVTPVRLPPAEALQQNVTPTKAMEQTSIGTVVMSTDTQMIETTTLSIEIQKNIGTPNCTHLLIIVLTFFVHYCLYIYKIYI